MNPKYHKTLSQGILMALLAGSLPGAVLPARAAPGDITRVSVDSMGEQADKGAIDPSISGDGRYVTFSSSSNNLMSEDTEGFEYVYVHDRQTGETTPVSFDNGYPMYGWAEGSVISDDGRYIAFGYDDKGDGVAVFWIYVHDRVSGESISPTVGSDIHPPVHPSLSADGRFLAHDSGNDKLVTGDTNGAVDVFVKEVAYPPDLDPTVKSIINNCPYGCSGPADPVVNFTVTFSEAVTGVDITDFTLTVGGGVTGAAITKVARHIGYREEYIVSVNTGTGDGTLRLDVIDDDSILDFPLNPLGGPGAGNGNFSTGEVYTVDKTLPIVTSIARTDPSPTALDTVHFTVTFSEAVSGVDAIDFSLVTTGSISGANFTNVTGVGNSYAVTAATGTGDGTLRLDVIDNNSIIDVVNNVPLGGFGMGDGDFTSGETYTIERSVPAVTGSLRADPDPTAADSVHFTVTFSKAVSGVDASDFALFTTGGVSGANVTEVSGSGNTCTVTAGTGSGNGTLRLDVMDNDSIIDDASRPLGGAGVGNGNFTTGEVYTINKAPVTTVIETFRSNGTNDGWVLESSEDSNQGGSRNATATTFRLGDDAQDRQYRAILHFPTYYLPDNAVVVEAILMIKVQGLVGTDPFTTHQNIVIDIKDGPFGAFGPFGINALQVTDFQDTASGYSVGIIQNNPVGGWYWTLLTARPLRTSTWTV